MVVEGLLYTKEHQWVKIEGETAIIGITDYAQEMLGEVTFVELPKVGKELKLNEELSVVESSKTASEINSPVVGTVAQANTELESAPELINEDCYQAGWLCKLTIIDSQATRDLMDAKQYEDYLKQL